MNRRPLFNATLAFICGLVIGRYVNAPWWVSVVIGVLAAAIWVAGFVYEKTNWRAPAGLVCALALGVLRITPVAHPHLPPDHIAHWADQGKVAIEAVVESLRPPSERGDELLMLNVTKVLRGPDEWTPAAGELQVRVRRRPPSLSRGDVVSLTTDIRFATGFRTPGAYDRVWVMGADGVYVTGYVRNGDKIDLVRAAAPTAAGAVDRVRGAIRAAALRGPPERAAVVLALILGDESRLDRSLLDAFQATGLMHIVAISGLHVSAAAGLVFLLVWLALARAGRLPLYTRVDRWAALIALPFPIIYAVLAGGVVSVMRAAVMYLALIVGILVGRRRDPYNALALAALVILVYRPADLWSKGFQFSFSAVLGMIYFHPLIADLAARATFAQRLLSSPRTARLRRRFLRACYYAAAGFIATAPVSLWHLGFVAPFSLVANLAAVPMLGLFIVPPLLFGAALLPLSETLAQWCWAVCAAAMDQIYGMTLLLLRLGPRFMRLGRPTWWEIAALVALLLALPHWRRRRARAVLVAGALVLLISPLALWLQNHWRDHLRVTMIDVGQGLSVLVETPGGRRLLYDGGGAPFSEFDVGRAALIPFLSAKRIRRLDVVVSSHPHPDHYKGLFPLLDAVPIGELWTIRPQHELRGTGQYFYLLELAREHGVRVRIFDSTSPPLRLGGADIAVLSPPPDPPDNWSMNDQSLVLRITHGGESVLLTGDAGHPVERRLLATGAPVQASVAQVGHHGSRTAGLREFVAGVAARFALVPVGRYNSWRLPAPEVMERWAAAGARVLRTDEAGTIACDWRSGAWRCSSLTPVDFDLGGATAQY